MQRLARLEADGLGELIERGVDLVELEQADAERAATFGAVGLTLHEALEPSTRGARAAGFEILEAALERLERRAIGGGRRRFAIERVERLHRVLGEAAARGEHLDHLGRLLAAVMHQLGDERRHFRLGHLVDDERDRLIDLVGRLEPVEQLAHAAPEQRLGIAQLHVQRHRRLQIGEQAERARLGRVATPALEAQLLERADDARPADPRQQMVGPAGLGLVGRGQRADQLGNDRWSGGAGPSDQLGAVGAGRDLPRARLRQGQDDLT